ncbi:hypothetical protein SR187_3750 [Streptococcus ruminantium]|uniref:Uncharacterized protein n=1 Tax=Streptococcus ruminantium TaxID=1917441 RepID=A0A2Z5TLY0_9STRE|nr:hypothetical protein SR187_3750 [Streptococcus ruminantium]
MRKVSKKLIVMSLLGGLILSIGKGEDFFDLGLVEVTDIN